MINVRKYFSRTQESIGGAIPSGLALFVVMFFYWIQQPLILSDFGVAGLSAGFYTLAAQGQLRLIASSAGEQSYSRARCADRSHAPARPGRACGGREELRRGMPK